MGTGSGDCVTAGTDFAHPTALDAMTKNTIVNDAILLMP
jgi:hypothetical protein